MKNNMSHSHLSRQLLFSYFDYDNDRLFANVRHFNTIRIVGVCVCVVCYIPVCAVHIGAHTHSIIVFSVNLTLNQLICLSFSFIIINGQIIRYSNKQHARNTQTHSHSHLCIVCAHHVYIKYKYKYSTTAFALAAATAYSTQFKRQYCVYLLVAHSLM